MSHTRLQFIFATVFFVFGFLAHPVYLNYSESLKVYGADLTEKPWAPEACMAIAQAVQVAQIVKKSGGRKSLFMPQVEERAHDAEVVREVSLAWDKDVDANEWVQACFVKVYDYKRKNGSAPNGPEVITKPNS